MSTVIDSSLIVRAQLEYLGISETLKRDITELAINEPYGYWIEKNGIWEYIRDEKLSYSELEGLAVSISVFNKKTIDRSNPIQSLTLPNGERCQIVMPPVNEEGKISFTIRKPSSSRFSLDDYERTGRMQPKVSNKGFTITEWEGELLTMMNNGYFSDFFKMAVKYNLNIVTVGGTGSGKTTFSKALIDLYPTGKRVFTIEDAHELTTPMHQNSVHLFFSPQFTAKDVLASCMRMKPDHIFITELRGDETWDYLMALKSGHSGSVTSIHANDCLGALHKIASYIKQSEIGMNLDFSFIMDQVMNTIDVVVYFENTHLKEIHYDPMRKYK